jgi:hypothetical protein
LSLDELNQGLMHLNLGHKVQLTHDEFWQCAQDGRLLNEEGELEPEGFRRMIVSQLRLFISRQIIQVMGRLELEQRGHEPQPDQTILLALKTVMNHVHDVHAAVDRVSHKIDPRGSKDLANSQRSRMEIIVALQKLAMRKAWRRWCVSIWGDQQWREREMDDREYMTTRLDRVEETLSGVQARVLAHACAITARADCPRRRHRSDIQRARSARREPAHAGTKCIAGNWGRGPAPPSPPAPTFCVPCCRCIACTDENRAR